MADYKPYLIINLILAALIGSIFLYSGLFSAERDNYPMPSFYKEITGQAAPSSGMSKAFSEIIRGNLEAARDFNPDSPRIFAFFLIQAVQRLAVSFLLVKCRIQRNYLLAADVIISVGLFLVAFQGQMKAMIQLLTST